VSIFFRAVPNKLFSTRDLFLISHKENKLFVPSTLKARKIGFSICLFVWVFRLNGMIRSSCC